MSMQGSLVALYEFPVKDINALSHFPKIISNTLNN